MIGSCPLETRGREGVSRWAGGWGGNKRVVLARVVEYKSNSQRDAFASPATIYTVVPRERAGLSRGEARRDTEPRT